MRTLKYLLVMTLLTMSSASMAKLNIFTCEPEWASLAREIGADRVNVSTAISADQDPHKVQARPSLISAARNADLIFCTGAELEVGWLPVLLSRSANPRIQKANGVLYAADLVPLLEKPATLDRSHGDIHAAGNPHMHLDPRRIIPVAEQLTARLAELDAEGTSFYQGNLRDFLNRWNAAIDDWELRATGLRGTKVVVHHRSFSYLLDWLGMTAVAEMEPKPGLPPTPGHLSDILKQVQEHGTKMVLYTSFNGDQGARWLAERSAVCAVLLPYSHEDSLFLLFDALINTLNQHQAQCS
jgi:zinc/manganese transport system substrate-binding protein